jgi:mannose-1-phosphate guanylyltransferase
MRGITTALSWRHAMMTDHLWGIVLAGSAEHRPVRGPHNQRLRRSRISTSERHILFRQALDRAARLIEPDRLCAVLARDHCAYYDTELRELPGVRRILQPAYRGSAPELFLPVLRIAHEDPHATVVVVPSDQLVDGEARLMAYVGRAAQAVARRPDLVVVIGAHPLGLGLPCTWIEPGDLVEGLEALAVRTVRRFVGRPSRGEAVALYAGDALVNTHVVIAKVRALLELGRRYLPDVLETLEPLEAAFGMPEERLMCEAVYEQMPYADIAHALFVRPHHAAVLPVSDVRISTEDPVPAVHALAS